MSLIVFAPPPELDIDKLAKAIKDELTADTPKQTKIISPLAPGDEFSHLFDDETRFFLIRVRDNLGAVLKLAYITGFTDIFWTIARGTVCARSLLDSDSLTIYLQCNKASQTIEIEEWK